MKHRGFTVIELVIVITILGIIITFASASLNNSINNARDNERKTDIETIALSLENYYNSEGNGTYPWSNPDNGFILNPTTILDDIDTNALMIPGEKYVQGQRTSLITLDIGNSVIPDIEVEAYSNHYIYQPLTNENGQCLSETIECRKFNLYCWLEVEKKVYMVSSKNQ